MRRILVGLVVVASVANAVEAPWEYRRRAYGNGRVAGEECPYVNSDDRDEYYRCAPGYVHPPCRIYGDPAPHADNPYQCVRVGSPLHRLGQCIERFMRAHGHEADGSDSSYAFLEERAWAFCRGAR